MIGSGVLLIIFAMALLAPFLAPNDPYTQDLSRRLVTPIWHANGTWEHPLGTDAFGRDYLSRIMYGAQVSLLIGFSAMAISCVIGTAMGIAAGYFGGRVDMRSEEHTSELQSLMRSSYAVLCLTKKNNIHTIKRH